MNFKELDIHGVYEIDLFSASDERGRFTKTFHLESFSAQGLDGHFEESFFSTNQAGVIRGMHFQHPPEDHNKLVYATSGRILDVILDIRKSSPTYGKSTAVEISLENHKAVYMPKGVAHGFYCLTDATMVYLTSTMHHPDSDDGIRYDSFDRQWPVNDPIISERDQAFQSLSDFNSPFE